MLARGFWRRTTGTLALAVALAALAGQAWAQNLVQNPNFLNDLTGYTTSGDVGVYQLSDGNFAAGLAGVGENSPQLPGPVFTASQTGSTLSQAIPTTPGVDYVITFFGFVDPGAEDVISASFGDTSISTDVPTGTGGNDISTLTLSDFDTKSFDGVATGSSTDLTFTADQGGLLITGIDVEPESAPAPIVGGGVASLSVALAGLALRRLRCRTTRRMFPV